MQIGMYPICVLGIVVISVVGARSFSRRAFARLMAIDRRVIADNYRRSIGRTGLGERARPLRH